eukprot:gene21506-25865_t
MGGLDFGAVQSTHQLPGSREGFTAQWSPPQADIPPWKLACSPSAKGPSFGGLLLKKTVLRNREPSEKNFLEDWLGPRAMTHEIDLLPTLKLRIPERSYDDNGRRYEFVAAKVHEAGAQIWGGKKKVLRLLYAAASGPGLKTISLRTELESLAAFDTLPSTRKVAARLELLMSPAPIKKIYQRRVADFELIPEPQPSEESGGCGFIPEDLLIELLGGRAPAKRATTVQVRIVAPHLGVYKGILCRKRGIEKIQLPPSMHKVGPSLIAGSEADWACLLITQVHPTTINTQMGKWVSGVDPPKSFTQNRFSLMIEKLWRSLGVSSTLLKEYVAAREVRGEWAKGLRALRCEAWVVGAADPTDAIPEGHIFVTGLKSHHLPVAEDGQHCVFLTRSPCVKPGDGRILPVVTSCPEGMSPAVWTWLEQRPLGEVLFSNAGSRPMPETVAAGDLDGDYYFVCWDNLVVANIQPRELQDAAGHNLVDNQESKVLAKETACTLPSQSDEDWLGKVHGHMTDVEVLKESLMIGKLYKAMERKSASSPLGADGPDYLAFADAYLQSIDRGKHGNSFSLPEHLCVEVGM